MREAPVRRQGEASLLLWVVGCQRTVLVATHHFLASLDFLPLLNGLPEDCIRCYSLVSCLSSFFASSQGVLVALLVSTSELDLKIISLSQIN